MTLRHVPDGSICVVQFCEPVKESTAASESMHQAIPRQENDGCIATEICGTLLKILQISL